MSSIPRFVGPGHPADVAALIVTYNSAGHLDRLITSLRHEATDTRIRVVVADNASSDDTLAVARAHDDVVAVESGGNLGYAAGINVAMDAAGDSTEVLVLNPDLWLEPGCVQHLRRRRRTSGASVVVPRILAADGTTYPSLRREPTLLRALGDAAFGHHFGRRPGAFSEIVRSPADYLAPHRIDWATGAALLIATATARAIGPWDDRFFLYSEETDFFRRARASGAEVWYEPEAVVHHAQGASGQSVALDTLMAVNRIRYARKHHHRLAATAYRGAVVLHEAIRITQPAHRQTLRAVLSERSWRALPQASTIRPRTQPRTPAAEEAHR